MVTAQYLRPCRDLRALSFAGLWRNWGASFSYQAFLSWKAWNIMSAPPMRPANAAAQIIAKPDPSEP